MISDAAGPSPHPRANYVNMAGLGKVQTNGVQTERARALDS